MEIFAGWIVLSIIVGALASGKGSNGFGMFLVSLVLSPLIGFLIVLAMKDKKARAEADARAQMIAKTVAAAQPVASPGDTKACPRCAETIKLAAIVCRFCGAELAPNQPSSGS